MTQHYSLDKIDRRLIYELDLDCRQSGNDLAKKLGSRKSVIHYRIKRLQESGFIVRHITFKDSGLAGQRLFYVFLQMGSTDEDTEKRLRSYFRADERISWYVATLGRYDLAFQVVCDEFDDFYNILNDINSICAHRIRDQAVFIRYRSRIYSRKYLVQDIEGVSPVELVRGSAKSYTLDGKDEAIFAQLKENPMKKILSIAQATGLSHDTVQRRLADMLSGGLIRFKAVLNLEALGYRWFICNLVLNATTEDEKCIFYSRLKNHPYITLFMDGIGRWNAIMNIHAHSSEDCQKIMHDLRTEFPELVRSYEILTTLHTAREHSTKG